MSDATEQKSSDTISALTEAIGHLARGIKELCDAGHRVRALLDRCYATWHFRRPALFDQRCWQGGSEVSTAPVEYAVCFPRNFEFSK